MIVDPMNYRWLRTGIVLVTEGKKLVALEKDLKQPLDLSPTSDNAFLSSERIEIMANQRSPNRNVQLFNLLVLARCLTFSVYARS